MKHLFWGGVAGLLATALASGAGLPNKPITGEYVEARTADVYTGPCFANGEVGLAGELAVFGWKIEKGSWRGTPLDGLAVVGVVRASNTLGNYTETVYPVKAVLIVDQRAGLEQRAALRSFAQRMSGDLLQDIVRVEYVPIQFEVMGHGMHAASVSLSAGTLASIRTRSLGEGDQICHNEETWYDPLVALDHAMPAYTLEHRFHGQGLGETWSSPDKRSAFVGSFHYTDSGAPASYASAFRQ